MIRRIANLVKVFFLSAIISCLMVAPATAKAAKKMASDNAAMHMHHMHTMMNHGFVMVMQGTNLVMLSEMKMAPGVDETTMVHGRKMMEEGKAMIQEMLGGKQMSALHKQGHGSGPNMNYTHDLGNAMLAMIADVEKMDMKDVATPEGMKMHHMHVALNHALEMADEGSSLVMLGKMKMAGAMDNHSVKHGRDMITEAGKLWQEIISSPAMSAPHGAGTTPEASETMAQTHKIASDGKKILDLLANMPAH